MVDGKEPDAKCALFHLPFTLYHFSGFLILAAVWTWPVAAHLSSRIPHDPGDPILNTWILWWNAHAIPFTERWWNPPIFFPMRGALALSEHLAGLSPIATPLQLAGANALAAYNVSLILSFALSGLFAWLLVLRLTGSPLAAVCAGLAYGFGPYRAGQLAHLQVLTSQWMPLMLLGLHQYVETAKRRWLVVFGAAWLLQALSNGYYLLFVPVLIVMWLAWFVDWRRSSRTGAAIAGAWLVASLPLVPVLLEYREVHHGLRLSRSYEEILHYSATAASFAQRSPMLRVFPGTPVAGEQHLFPGVTVPVLIVAAAVLIAVRRRRTAAGPSPLTRAFVYYAGSAAVMWLLACGPAGPDDRFLVVLRPYSLLLHLPGFEGLRVPSRFAMLAMLSASVAAGIAVAWIAPRRAHLRLAFAAAVIAGLLADGWMRPMPVFAAPARMPLPDIANSAIVELPTDEPSVAVSAMYRSMQHRRPLVSGYSGHTPPHYFILSAAMRRGDASPLLYLARGRSLIIVVDERRDPSGDFRRLVRGLPGIERRTTTGSGEIYVLAPTVLPREITVGPRLAATLDDAAGERRIDLGGPHVLRTIEFPLRDRYMSLYTRMAFAVSNDGQSWTTVWDDWTGGLAMEAALRDGREAPVRITLPDVTARYIRFSPAPEWLWHEIRLYGP